MVADPRQSPRGKPWCATVSLLFFLGLAGVSTAGEFKVSPILQTVAPQQSMATYRLQNTGSRSITVQIGAYRWWQDRGRRQLEPADRLLVVPPLITIAPGATQLVRVALENPARNRELPYRIQFEEIPEQRPPGQITVSTALRIDVPLFFGVPGAVADVEWGLRRDDGGGLVLTASNRGEGHARFSAVTLKTGDGEELASRRGPQYLLPGNERHWRFHDIRRNLPGELVLEVEAERDGTRHVLAIE